MRHLLLAALCAAGAWNVQAATQTAPETWTFTYTGFHVDLTENRWNIYEPVVTTTTNEFRPNATLSGSFTASDTNGNGVIDLAELTGFRIGDHNFFACAPVDDMIRYDCRIDKFSYVPGGKLDIEAGWGQTGEVYWSRDFRLDTDWGFQEGGRGRYSDYFGKYEWTEQTRLSITPVPEPASGAMAGAGVLLLGLVARARRFPVGFFISRRP